MASHGRLCAGLGAGWYEHEWRAYGYEWLEIPDRLRRFREAVEIVHKMWTESAPEFTGEHYRIDKPINEPKGVRKRHPMFWIGGGGEQVTLRLDAEFGDACNINGDDATITHKLDVLKRHCDRLDRDFVSIVKSSTVPLKLLTADEAKELNSSQRFDNFLVGTSSEVRNGVEQLAAIGIDYVLFYVEDIAYRPELVDLLNDEVVKHYL